MGWKRPGWEWGGGGRKVGKGHFSVCRRGVIEGKMEVVVNFVSQVIQG